MARNTRSRRGEAVADMQNDPEAILRNRRQAGSTANRRKRHSNTGDMPLPQTPRAAPSHKDDAEQANGDDDQTSNQIDRAAAHHDSEQDATRSSDEGPQDDRSSLETALTGEQADGPRNGPTQDSAFEDAEQGTGSRALDADQDASTSNGATSTTASATNPGGSSETDQPNSSDHDLDNEEKQDPDSQDLRQSPSDGASAGHQSNDLGGKPTGHIACQELRASITAFQTALAETGPPALDDEVTIQYGRDLPIDAIHLAIGSVSEAVSERGETLFSLIDRVSESQAAARPGRPLFWPFHRARPNRRGRHFSLLLIEERGGQPRGITVEHRDSWTQLRRTVNVGQTWRDIRPLLAADGIFEWDTTETLGQDANLEVVNFPQGQYDQTHHWTCGLCTIINAWICALGLEYAVAARRQMTEAFARDACTIADLAMRGSMDSTTIRNFLECYGCVDTGAQVGHGRAFDRTVRLSSANALTRRVRRVRLQEELARRREEDDEDYPSLDNMMTAIVAALGRADLMAFDSVDDLLVEYASARAISGAGLEDPGSNSAGAIEDDAALALRVQNEEFMRNATPEQGGVADEQVQYPTSGIAAKDNAQTHGDNEAAGQIWQDTDGQQQQQTNATIQEGSSATGQDMSGTDALQQPGNATGQISASEREGVNGAQLEQVMDVRGGGEEARPHREDRPPSANNESAAGEDEEEEGRRHQRAYALLRPVERLFKPGAPLRAPSAVVERAAREEVSELSVLVSQYSNSPRHQDIRERLDLPDWTNIFVAPTQQQQGWREQNEELYQEYRQGAEATLAAEAALADAQRQEKSGASDAAQGEQSSTTSQAAPSNAPQDVPAAATASAQGSNEVAHASAAGVPAIPGLQSTIPAASTSAPQQPDTTAAEASAVTGSAQTAANTQRGSWETESSLRSYEYYEREEKQGETARQAARDREHEQQLQQSREEFEHETGERRQRGREERDGQEGDSTGEDFDSLFDEDVDGASSATEGGDEAESLG